MSSSNPEHHRLKRRFLGLSSKFDFAMFCMLAAFGLALAFLAYSLGGVDFGVYYAAGRVTIMGGNPYDYQQLASQIVTDTGELNNPYYYAPWFTWAVLPLSLLPYSAARMAWSIINVLLWFVSLHNLTKIVDWPRVGWRRWGMYLLMTVVFAWSTWGFEQVGILVFFMVGMFLLAAGQDRWFAAGVWLALSLFKPNITAIPVVCMVIWLILHKTWKPVITMVVLLVMMILISLLLSPQWYLALLQADKITGLSYTLNNAGGTEVARYNTTLVDWLLMYGVTGPPAAGVYAFVIVLGVTALVYSVLRSKSMTQLAAQAFLANFALIPYALFYDYPVLTLTLFYLNEQASRKSILLWAQISANIMIVLGLFVGDKISFRYWIVIILVVFGMITHFQELRMTARQQMNPP